MRLDESGNVIYAAQEGVCKGLVAIKDVSRGNGSAGGDMTAGVAPRRNMKEDEEKEKGEKK